MAPPPPGGDVLGPPRRFILPGLFVGALFLTVFLRAPETPSGPQVLVAKGPTMGTTYTVKVVAPEGVPLQESESALKKAVSRELEDINAALSTYRPDSELSRFNKSVSTAPKPASDALRFMISSAAAISEKSGGAFDVTIGPMVNAWGFGPDGRRNPPSAEALSSASQRVGYQMLTVDEVKKTVAKARPDLYVDLSAIAKGYGVDRLSGVIEKLGYENYLVEVGGELRGRGHNQHGKSWRVGIEKPSAGSLGIHEVLPLTNLAMATSGDYRNFYEFEGRLLSHTIDARTGRPIEHRLASVTVLAAQCANADAWATALNVLGPEDGYELAQRLNLAALFLIRDAEDSFREKVTKAFAAIREADQTGKAP